MFLGRGSIYYSKTCAMSAKGAKMESSGSARKIHSVTIKDGATVTGVTQVIGVGEREVTLKVGERTLILTGEGLSAEKLSIEEGIIVINGEVTGLKYASAADAKGLLKRLFK